MSQTVTRKRHVAKALTWRVTASLHTFLLGWLLTGRVEVGATIGIIELFTKTALYYFHERIWYQNRFGVTSESAAGEAAFNATLQPHTSETVSSAR